MSTDAQTSPPPNQLKDSEDAPYEHDMTALQDATTPVNQTNTSQPDLGQLQHDNTPDDPQVAALRAIFPDYDDSLLQSVLQSVAWDQGRAIDVLLGMSDPQYKTEPPNDRGGQAAPSQLDLDEQLARRLMLEEQEQHTLPYRPYGGSTRHSIRAQQQQPPQDGHAERDTMSELQGHISRFAETGKKTFDSLFSRVKAKIQEYDRPNKDPEASSVPSWGGAPSSSSEQWTRNGTTRQPSYYDPNPPVAAVTLSSPPSAGKTAVQGYDVEIERGTGTAEPSRTEPTPGVASHRTSTSARPVTTIDGGKLGLLPKRPVSLLKPPEKPSDQEPVQQHFPEDDNDLEYAENPFEDSHR
ncbi:hypothetical protein AX15_003230 [Amanita polypyramis BW_CC]|nr:hypothetical protein AX15_003230 [Amanita polypyramis BW_CC]